MKLVKDIVYFKQLYENPVGLEFEVEAKHPLPLVDTATWKAVRDPSLRGEAMEYVTRSPIPFKGVPTAVDKVINDITRSESEPNKASPRTSWHIHINQQNTSLVSLINGLFTYWLLEDLFIKYCAPVRRNNTFALTARNCPYIVSRLGNILEFPNYANFKDVTYDNYRYGAQNICSLHKFGTVEYRALEGTFDSFKVVSWVEALLSVWDYARNQKSPDDILDQYYALGQDKFAQAVIGYRSPLYSRDAYYDNSMPLWLIANLIEDWDEWSDEFVPQRQPIRDKFIQVNDPNIDPVGFQMQQQVLQVRGYVLNNQLVVHNNEPRH